MTETEERETKTKSGYPTHLGVGREGFLAQVLMHAFEIERRTPEDFIHHFPPSAIMKGLKDRPMLRAKILVETTGVKERIALKKSAESGGDDLQIALDEGETTAEEIVSLFDPDDRVRYLDRRDLWAFITEGEFWTLRRGNSDDFEYERAKAHVTFILERALENKLLSHEDVIEGLTVEHITRHLPKTELASIISRSLALGRDGLYFTHEHFLDNTPCAKLVDHIALPDLWDKIVQPFIVEAHGYAPDDTADGDASVPEDTDEAPPPDSMMSVDEDELIEAASDVADEASSDKKNGAETKSSSDDGEEAGDGDEEPETNRKLASPPKPPSAKGSVRKTNPCDKPIGRPAEQRLGRQRGRIGQREGPAEAAGQAKRGKIVAASPRQRDSASKMRA